MTIVSIRCSECDEVKRQEHMEMQDDGSSICVDCRGNERVREVEEEESKGNGEEEEEIESEASEGESEESENESKFTAEDALSW